METDPAVKYEQHQQQRYDYVSALVRGWEQLAVPEQTVVDTIDILIESETQRHKEALYHCRPAKHTRFRRIVQASYQRMLRMLKGSRALIVRKIDEMKVHS